MNRKLIAIDDRIIIHLEVKPEVKSEGGLILPGGDDTYMEYGFLVEVGPDANKDRRLDGGTPWLKVGQTVIVQKIAAPELVYQGRRAKILKASNVLAIVEDEKEEEKPAFLRKIMD